MPEIRNQGQAQLASRRFFVACITESSQEVINRLLTSGVFRSSAQIVGEAVAALGWAYQTTQLRKQKKESETWVKNRM